MLTILWNQNFISPSPTLIDSGVGLNRTFYKSKPPKPKFKINDDEDIQDIISILEVWLNRN